MVEAYEIWLTAGVVILLLVLFLIFFFKQFWPSRAHQRTRRPPENLTLATLATHPTVPNQQARQHQCETWPSRTEEPAWKSQRPPAYCETMTGELPPPYSVAVETRGKESCSIEAASSQLPLPESRSN